ncbi:NHL repeat protein, partial [Candidatus Nitrosopumilus salaria BD31]
QLGSGNGQLRTPQRVNVNVYGDIFVADTGNHRVQKFDSSGNFVLKFGSLGSGNEQFQFPTGVVMYDLSGYITDTNNNRVWSIHFSPEPIADNQHIQGMEDTASAITLTAYDANHDVLSFSVVSPPSHGSLSGTAPNLTYFPNLKSVIMYFGLYPFVFSYRDSQSSYLILKDKIKCQDIILSNSNLTHD